MKSLLLFIGIFAAYSISAQSNIAVTSTSIFEGEPTLAVHPSNSQHLVAAWIGVDFILGGVIKTSVSTNGGLTWSTPQSQNHVVSGNASADPSLQFNSSGEVFLCYIDYDNTNFTNGQIIIRKSINGGLSWGAAVEAISVNDCPDQYCVDRPWMEIDKSGGPNNGTIYVTSMNPDQPTLVVAPYHPYIAVSTDNGASFNDPRYLDTLNYNSGSTIQQPMPSPAIGADGTFYASYPSYEPSQSPFAHIYLAYSTNQGTTIDHRNLYTILIPGATDPYAKLAGKLFTDPTSDNHIVRLAFSSLNGDIDLFYLETFDAVNWSAPVRVNQDPISNGKMQDLVWGEFNENGDMAICWRDRRNASADGYQTETEIYGVVKFKDSVDFESDFQISSEQVPHATVLEGKGNDFMGVRFSGDTLYTIWGDVRTGTLNIYLNRKNVREGTSSTVTVSQEKPIIQVLPNPVQNTFSIQSFDKAINYFILNNLGQKVMSIDNETVDISNLAKGNYYLVYQIARKQYSTPFVIE